MHKEIRNIWLKPNLIPLTLKTTVTWNLNSQVVMNMLANIKIHIHKQVHCIYSTWILLIILDSTILLNSLEQHSEKSTYIKHRIHKDLLIRPSVVHTHSIDQNNKEITHKIISNTLKTSKKTTPQNKIPPLRQISIHVRRIHRMRPSRDKLWNS